MRYPNTSSFHPALNTPRSFISSSGGPELFICILPFFVLFISVILSALLPAELLKCIYLLVVLVSYNCYL